MTAITTGKPLLYFCLVCGIMLYLTEAVATTAERQVRIGYEENLPLVGTATNGKAQGIMIDVVEEVARKEGWAVTYASCLWKTCLENLEAGNINLLLAIAKTPDRSTRFNYNQHTVISNWGLIYSRPELHIESYSDLNGKRIAVVEDDVYCNTFVKMMQDFAIRCDLVMASNFQEIFNMIDRGEVDAGVANRFFSLLHKHSFQVKATSIIFSPVSVQVAAPKEQDGDILTAFDFHVENMKKDRTSVYHQSLKRWLEIEDGVSRIPLWVWWLAGAILVGTIFLAGFVFLLRREVQRKTAYLIHEVTQRQRSEEQLRLVLDNMQGILVHAAFDGTIHFISSGIRLLGYHSEELQGGLLQKLFKNTQDYEDLLTDLKKKNTVTGFRLPMIAQDGRERLVTLNADIFQKNGAEATSFIASGTDISEQAKLEELMVQNEKMTMIGGLAAGMAHEINNPLGIIMQHTQNITRRISPGVVANQGIASKLGIELQQLHEYLEQREILKFLQQIHEAADRMSRIISNILKFSRKSTSRIESADLSMVIEQSLELAKNDYDLKKNYDFKKINIIRDYTHDLPKAPIVVLELEQVLLNLFKNAAQAMTSHEKDKQPCIILRTRRAEDWAVVEVEDNGPGMSEEVQSRIFDPFYTTKEAGLGTGLGLSVSYAIITNTHHGRLAVKSRPEGGTCFTISLPLNYVPLAIM